MIITAKIFPGSKKEHIAIEEDIFGDKIYKIRIIALPEAGKANVAVIALLAEYFKVAKSQIAIIKGFSTRMKTISIEI